MKRTLIDAGPLIALFDKDDHYYFKALNFIKNYDGLLVTTWPVVTEVLYMLDFNINVQIDFLRWIEKGGLEIYTLLAEDMSRIIDLTQKYSNVPMDFADATLIVASEKLDIDKIVTVDSDFYVYRNIRNKYLTNIFIE